jgi:hypothetical protein
MKPKQYLKQRAALRTTPHETNTTFETAIYPENEASGSRYSLRNSKPP